MPEFMLICNDVAGCPTPEVPSLRGTCAKCGQPVWVSFSGAAMQGQRWCIPCAGRTRRTGMTRFALPFTPGLGNGREGARLQVVTWLRDYAGLNLTAVRSGHVDSDTLERVSAHCGRTGDLVGAQIMLSLAAFTEPERAEIVRQARA